MRRLFKGLIPIAAALVCLPPTSASAAEPPQKGVLLGPNRAERVVVRYHASGATDLYFDRPTNGGHSGTSWIVPVEGIPKVQAGARYLMTALDEASYPKVISELRWPKNCSTQYPPPGFWKAGGNTPAIGQPPPTPPSVPGSFETDLVSVKATGTTGPYEYVIVGVDPSAKDPADAALRWLNGNGYPMKRLEFSHLRSFAKQGAGLLAVRLAAAYEPGTTPPIIVRYDHQPRRIPLLPLTYGDSRQTEYKLFVIGNGRAFPTNFRSLQLNDAYLPWQGHAQEFRDLALGAIAEAGQGGFFTELASAYQLPASETGSPQTNAGMAQLLAKKPSDEELLARAVKLNAGAESELTLVLDRTNVFANTTETFQFARCPDCFALPLLPGFKNFNREAFLRDLDEFIIKPRAATAEVFAVGSPQILTRLYTITEGLQSYSPSLMLKPGAPAIKRERKLYLNLSSCSSSSPLSGVTEMGHVLKGSDGKLNAPSGMLPKNGLICQAHANGAIDILEDNRLRSSPDSLHFSPPDGGDEGCSHAGNIPQRSGGKGAPLLALVMALLLHRSRSKTR